MADARLCPHCHLPAALPEVCTPALNEVLEQQIARDWELFNAGYELGKRVGAEAALAAPAGKA